jgi:anti-sigma B factor antagonist
MPVPPSLNVHRHDTDDTHRALITLSGEIDLDTAPAVREALSRCLRDGVQVIDVDLTAVSFCDCSGLNAFLGASEAAVAAGVLLRLHFPCPMLFRLLRLTGSASRLLAFPVRERVTSLPISEPAHAYATAGSPNGLARAVAVNAAVPVALVKCAS